MPERRRSSLIGRLRARGVFRVAASYAVIAWLLLQIADVTLEPLGAPPWTMRLLITLALCGFPVAIALAWFFELTPSGAEFDSAVGEAPRPAVAGWRRYADVILIGALSVAVIYLLLEDSEWLAAPPPGTASSVAVLPFSAFGDGADVELLGAGLSGEVRDRLARIGGLRVIASSSSFQFESSPPDIREVGRRLGSDAVLEGRVSQNGERLQLSLQLVGSENGEVLWSTTIDRDKSALPALPGEIVRSVAAVLLPGSDDAAIKSGGRGTAVVSAQELYLLARSIEGPDSTLYTDNTERVRDLYAQAIAADPGFAAAHAALGRAELVLNRDLVTENAEGLDQRVLPHLDRALELDPAHSEAYVTKGMLRRWTLRPGGDVYYRLAVEVGPNNALAHHNLGNWAFVSGRFDTALELVRKARELDPMTRYAHERLFDTLIALGRGDQLAAVVDRMDVLFPDDLEIAVTNCQVARWNGIVDEGLACLAGLLQRHPGAPPALASLAEMCAAAGLRSCQVLALEALANEGDPMAQLELAVIADDNEKVARLLADQGEVSGNWAGMLSSFAMEAGLWEEARRLVEASPIRDSIRDESLRFRFSSEVLFTLIELDRREGRIRDAGQHLDVLLNWTAAYEKSGARAWWFIAERAEALTLAARLDEALTEFERLETAFALPCDIGYIERLETDALFAELRNDPRFMAVIETLRAQQSIQRERLPTTLAAHGVTLPGL